MFGLSCLPTATKSNFDPAKMADSTSPAGAGPSESATWSEAPSGPSNSIPVLFLMAVKTLPSVEFVACTVNNPSRYVITGGITGIAGGLLAGCCSVCNGMLGEGLIGETCWFAGTPAGGVCCCVLACGGCGRAGGNTGRACCATATFSEATANINAKMIEEKRAIDDSNPSTCLLTLLKILLLINTERAATPALAIKNLPTSQFCTHCNRCRYFSRVSGKRIFTCKLHAHASLMGVHLKRA